MLTQDFYASQIIHTNNLEVISVVLLNVIFTLN